MSQQNLAKTHPSLDHLSSAELLDRTRQVAAQERKVTALVLEHLREVERRRLYADLGYPSLFEFAVSELKYSESSAHRRISAMRLSREVPSVAPAIEAGTLSLSVVSQAQRFFRVEKIENGKTYTPTQKEEILEGLIGKSSRECERDLAARSPEFAPKEKTRALSAAKLR